MAESVHVPFHTHSEYSALDGLSTCREIAQRCCDLELPAAGLSDHGTVAGHLSFAKEMQAADLKPVFCAELYHGVEERPKARDQAHLLVGALNDEGLRNLWRLTDASHHNFYHVGRVTWEMLEQYNEGLFATSACIQGLVAQGVINNDLSDLNRYLEIFGDRFYLELHTYPGEEHERLNMEYSRIADEKGVGLLVATDAHYAFPDQYELHDIYLADQTKQTVSTPPEERKMWHPKSLYIQSADEIRENFFYLPSDVVEEALVNGLDLADGVSADLPEIKRHLPLFVPSQSEWVEQPDTSPAALFIDLVEQGLVDRYGADAPEEVWERAEKEMTVFLDAGLEHYFLQAWDFVQFCNHNGIRIGPGRGSAGGAIVAYAMKITDIDPIHYDLSFERFYNAGREKGLPDIDIDFPTTKRTKVRKYLAKRWGEKKVRTIGTVARMKPKAAAIKMARPMGISYKDRDELIRIISKVPDIEIHGHETIGWDEEIDPGKTIYVMDHVGDEIRKWKSGDTLRDTYIDAVRHICSRVSHYGIHPSGTVISDVDLSSELPSRWVPKENIFVTMFPMADVEKRQFMKDDLLGLRNLDTIEKWEELHGPVEWSGLDKQEWPDELWKFFGDGNTAGTFQIEGGYARQLCKQIKPTSIEEIAAIVALNRPGPIRSGVPDSYIARKNGEHDDKFDGREIPILADILDETYGHFLYQEQVINFMSAIDYNPSDADAIRKILGKKKPEDMRDLGSGKGEWRGKGYLEMAQEAGLSEDTARLIWQQIEEFASYSFNKSHAAAYAIMAFRTVYPKWKALQEAYLALIETHPEGADRYVREARKNGVKVMPPEIDRSDVSIDVVDGDILFGFSNIKGIGKETAKYIVSLREMYDLTSPEKMYEAVEGEQKVWESEDKDKREPKSPRQKFRKDWYGVLYNAGCWDGFEDRSITLEQRQKTEKEMLKVIVTDNTDDIFDLYEQKVNACDPYPPDESEVSHVRLPGVVMNVDEKKTKKDKKSMGVITIEYEGDEMEFVVFPNDWKSSRFLWKDRAVGIFELKRNDRGWHFEAGTKLK